MYSFFTRKNRVKSFSAKYQSKPILVKRSANVIFPLFLTAWIE